jgi:hypothetical protein
MPRRATKGDIRELIRALREEGILELKDAVTADDGPRVVAAVQAAESLLEDIRELAEDRYDEAFDEIEGPVIPEGVEVVGGEEEEG